MKALALLVSCVYLYGLDISQVVKLAHENNPTVLKLQHQIQTKDYDIKNSDIYKNPVVTFGLNDINFDNPQDRDIEAMQTNFILISQEIIGSDKLKLQTNIEVLNKNIATLVLVEQKNRIEKNIYSLYFLIQQLETNITYSNEKIENINKIKNYHNNHIRHKKAFQSSIQNELMVDRLHLKIASYKQKIAQAYAKISQLVNSDITSITYKSIRDDNFAKGVDEHTLLKIQEILIKKSIAKKSLAKENESANYTLSGGYYNRVSRDDYVSIALKIPLNIYNKEKNQSSKAIKEIDIAKSEYENSKSDLVKRYKIELSNNKLAKQSISYIKKIIEHLKKEKELISSQNSIDNLIEVLAIENKILDNQIELSLYKKELDVSIQELKYLTSTVNKE